MLWKCTLSIKKYIWGGQAKFINDFKSTKEHTHPIVLSLWEINILLIMSF